MSKTGKANSFVVVSLAMTTVAVVINDLKGGRLHCCAGGGMEKVENFCQ